MFQHPMPSFLLQQDNLLAPSQTPPQAHMQGANIFAPIPQYQYNNNFFPGTTGTGPDLSIDTSHSYSMDFRQFNGPVSSGTTANSPSESGTSAFFTSVPPGEILQTPQFQTSFSNGFLSVDQAALIGTSNTPISIAGNNGDPVIADYSPPLGSSDMYGTPCKNPHFSDDQSYLSESLDKQMSLPFRGAMSDESFHTPLPQGSWENCLQAQPNILPEAQRGQLFHGQGQLDYQNANLPLQDGSTTYQSPTPHTHPRQMHQDSGVSFSTPSQMSQDRPTIYNTPSESGMLYQDSKMYQSPAPLRQLPEDQQMYHTSPLSNAFVDQEELDLQNMGLYDTIDPHSLGRHQPHMQQH